MFMTMMRRHSKSILIKIIVGLIGVVFVFWGIYSIRGARPGSKIAYVNGDLISGLEYQATYRDMLLALMAVMVGYSEAASGASLIDWYIKGIGYRLWS